MVAKANGAEFKRFYNDPQYWPEGAWHEDAMVVVDGAEAGAEFDLDAIADTAKVAIHAGVVFMPERDDPVSLETQFKRWRKEQSIRTLMVDVDVGKLDAVMAAIKAAGGKVL